MLQTAAAAGVTVTLWLDWSPAVMELLRHNAGSSSSSPQGNMAVNRPAATTNNNLLAVTTEPAVAVRPGYSWAIYNPIITHPGTALSTNQRTKHSETSSTSSTGSTHHHSTLWSSIKHLLKDNHFVIIYCPFKLIQGDQPSLYKFGS